MSTHNIGFYEDLTKIIFELSSNTHLISSAETYLLRILRAFSASSLLQYLTKQKLRLYPE